MTRSSNNHSRGAGTGAGRGTTAARDEAAVLAASGHLTDRDRELIRLVARLRVLTTGQLAALGFSSAITARHRLALLVRLGMLRRFRPRRETGSAPWHYVLGPIGAAMLGQEDRDEKKWAPQVRADRQLALERSQRLSHMTGTNWFFVQLARHAREHGGELQWKPEQEAAEHLYVTRWDAETRPHPDGMGIWAEDGTDIVFFLEYDTGTEDLPRVIAKLAGYRELAARTRIATPVLFWLASGPRREQQLRSLLAAAGPVPGVPVATATPASAQAAGDPAGPAWLPAWQPGPRQRLAHLTARPPAPPPSGDTGLPWHPPVPHPPPAATFGAARQAHQDTP